MSPETWLGNIQRAAENLGVMAREFAAQTKLPPQHGYCNRCGVVHEIDGECLRGDR